MYMILVINILMYLSNNAVAGLFLQTFIMINLCVCNTGNYMLNVIKSIKLKLTQSKVTIFSKDKQLSNKKNRLCILNCIILNYNIL